MKAGPVNSCPNCGCNEVEVDAAQGTSFCVKCGTVLEENTIVAEVTFSENAAGVASLQGQFVSSDKGRAFGAVNPFGRRLNPSESREITIANGRVRLQKLAIAVKLSEHHVEMAHRWFILALQHNFTRGRRSHNVMASCLYIVCRQEKTPHMLLDFADILQTNVYALGNTFLKLLRLLNIDLPLVDPSLYISRFAARMELEDKVQVVANTALRLVSRMKRDWIQTGRRPAGICGACLLLAARAHGFRRTPKEIIQIVKVCEATIRRRLEEFAQTPSGNLTHSQFEEVWLEQECDPPAFTRSKEKKRAAAEVAKRSVMASEAGSDAASAISAEDSRQIERELMEVLGSKEHLIFENELIDAETKAKLARVLAPPESQCNTVSLLMKNLEAGLRHTVATINNDDQIAWSDYDDDEVNNVLLDEAEIETKTKLWLAENGEYLEEQERKRNQQIIVDDSQKKTKRKKQNRPRKNAPIPASSYEAAKNMIATKKLSKKINYALLDTLFPESTPPLSPKAEICCSFDSGVSLSNSPQAIPVVSSYGAYGTKGAVIGGGMIYGDNDEFVPETNHHDENDDWGGYDDADNYND